MSISRISIYKVNIVKYFFLKNISKSKINLLKKQVYLDLDLEDPRMDIAKAAIKAKLTTIMFAIF